jgi:inorganic phosphate transporter, PiT family
MWRLFSSVFMGWSLGANDAANIFGIGVTSRILKFKTATLLLGVFVVLGAWFEGSRCMDSLGRFGDIGLNQAFVVTFSAAFAMTILTIMKIPASTSQAIVGSIIGATLIISQPNWVHLLNMAICWILTPVGGAFIAFFMYRVFDFIVSRRKQSTRVMQRFLYVTMVVSGCFGAYALGANNVANTTGVYVNTGMLSPQNGSLLGALSIALGAATFSRKVMDTVGNRITLIGPQGAVIATLAHSITLYIYAHIGVPVSSSQAIVGAVIGIGMVRGIRAVNRSVMRQIAAGWVFTPVLGGIFAFSGVILIEYSDHFITALKSTITVFSILFSCL